MRHKRKQIASLVVIVTMLMFLCSMCIYRLSSSAILTTRDAPHLCVHLSRHRGSTEQCDWRGPRQCFVRVPLLSIEESLSPFAIPVQDEC